MVSESDKYLGSKVSDLSSSSFLISINAIIDIQWKLERSKSIVGPFIFGGNEEI